MMVLQMVKRGRGREATSDRDIKAGEVHYDKRAIPALDNLDDITLPDFEAVSNIMASLLGKRGNNYV